MIISITYLKSTLNAKTEWTNKVNNVLHESTPTIFSDRRFFVVRFDYESFISQGKLCYEINSTIALSFCPVFNFTIGRVCFKNKGKFVRKIIDFLP